MMLKRSDYYKEITYTEKSGLENYSDGKWSVHDYGNGNHQVRCNGNFVMYLSELVELTEFISFVKVKILENKINKVSI